MTAKPTVYRGVSMRSKLEADWASTLDKYAIDWKYEPYLIELETGDLYLPDFWLPALRTFIEVKGMGVGRTEKTTSLANTLAREQPRGVIVLFGFEPAMREVTPSLWDPFLQWRDAAGYDSRFTVCGECAAWQWTRPQLTRRCRICRNPLRGLLAMPGELHFARALPDHVKLMSEQ